MKTTTITRKITIAVAFCLAFSATVWAQCNVTFTYTLGSAGQVTFSNTTTGMSGNTHYNWDFGYQGNGSTAASTTFTYPYNGTYIVVLHLSDSLNCMGSSTQTVTISNTQAQPPCQAAFTYTLGSSGLVSLTNTSITYTASTSSYSWTFGDNSSSTSTSPTHTYVYNGSYVITLNLSNSVENCFTSSTQTITVSNALTPPPCTSAFTYTIVGPGQVNFTSSYTGSSQTTKYAWDFGYNGQGSNVANPTYTYPYNGTYNISLTVSDSLNNFCHTTTTNTISITNTATQPCLPTASFTMHKDSINTGVWNVTPNYSSQVSSAVWHWGDGTSSPGFSPSHTYANPGVYHVCVTVYASCGDSSTTCQNDSIYRMVNNAANTMITVHVISTFTGIKTIQEEASALQLFPNPFSDRLIVKINIPGSNRINYSIYDMYGKIVLSETAIKIDSNSDYSINTGDLSQGVYFITVSNASNNNLLTTKIIK